LPSSSSSRLTGVVSRGSRVPCSRSPTTEYAAITAGSRAGAISSIRNVIPTALSTAVAPADGLIRKMMTKGFHEKNEREHRHSPDDEGAAAVLTQLLLEHSDEASEAEVHHRDASGASSISCR